MSIGDEQNNMMELPVSLDIPRRVASSLIDDTVALRQGEGKAGGWMETEPAESNRSAEQEAAERAAARLAFFRLVMAENSNDLSRELNKEAGEDPIPCKICNQYLNGEGQYADHLRGKRHNKHLKRVWRQWGWNLAWACGTEDPCRDGGGRMAAALIALHTPATRDSEGSGADAPEAPPQHQPARLLPDHGGARHATLRLRHRGREGHRGGRGRSGRALPPVLESNEEALGANEMVDVGVQTDGLEEADRVAAQI